MSSVETSLESHVLWITLSRPQVLNAVDIPTHEALRKAIRTAETDEIRAVVLTGSGRAFCVGQDLPEFRTLQWDAGEHLRRFYNPNILSLRRLPKPVIAAVNGITAGAGLGLACACDIRICSDKATFTPAFDSVALVPDSGTSFFVPRLIGQTAAFTWLTTGGTLNAEQAKAQGLVDEVVTDAELHTRVDEIATAYARRPGITTGMTKRLLNRGEETLLTEHLDFEAQLQRVAADSPDHQTAVAAFLNRRRR